MCEVLATRRDLVLWVETSSTPLQVTFAGQRVPARAEDVDGGTRLRLALPTPEAGAPSSSSELAVTAQIEGSRAEYRLRVEQVEEDAVLARVKDLRKRDRLKEAEEAMRPVETFAEPLRGRARSLGARLALASGRVEQATEELQRAMRTHRADGRASDEALDGMALAHTLLLHGRRTPEARGVLEQISPALEHWDEGRAQIGYYRSLVARDSGDLRDALRELRSTDRLGERLGLDASRRLSRVSSARLLQAVGDHEQASALLRALEAELQADVPACERATLMTVRGWSELLLWSASPPLPHGAAAAAGSSPSSGALSGEALLRYLDSTLTLWLAGCPRPADVANMRTNIALAALEAGDLARASREVREVREAGTIPAFVSEWLLDIEARIALRRGEPRRALALYAELAARGAKERSPEVRWRAVVGRGLALGAARDDASAEGALREAEALLDEQSAHVPLNEGRARFLAYRDQSVRLLVDLLLRRKDAAGALAAIRRARTRALRAAQRIDLVAALGPEARRRWEVAISSYLNEREVIEAEWAKDWSVPADRLSAARKARKAREDRARAALDDALSELAEGRPALAEQTPLAPGDLLLAFQISGDGARLHVVAQASGTIRAFDVAPISPGASEDELSEALLAPLAAELAISRKVRILTYGPLDAIDLHALPWRGQPLLAHVAVEYPADLPTPGASPRPDTTRRPRALVVGDTREDLPRSREESRAVLEALKPAWDTLRLEGKAATRPSVVSALRGTALFHYAGHASFDSGQSWDSALQLAEGSHLRTGDVLALPSVPSIVMLSACETGKSEPTRVAQLSLAHAFIAAGAELVIASSRPVEDHLAAALVARTYREATPGWDIGQSFRAALLDVARTMPRTQWRAYRLITR